MKLDHKGTVISSNSPDLPGAPNNPEDATYAKRILCEGDSWFSMGAIPSSNMLFPLTFAQSTVLYNIATPGDTMVHMSTLCKNEVLKKNLCLKKFAIKWDLIFISGGGNDLMDWVDRLLCAPSVGAGAHMLDYVNQIELARFRVVIQQSYLAIAAMRDAPDSLSKDVPIITHIYDYPTPRNAPAKFLNFGITGPWIYSAFKLHAIPEPLWISLTDYLFEFLAGVLIELPMKIANFHVITNTRETLVRATLGETGISGDWLNEIHPSATGYEKLAGVVSPELYSLLYP